jgi:hypothetical protein
MKRKRFQDVSKSSQPSISPYHNDPKTRHQRRYFFNLQHQKIVEQWCKENEISLHVKNEGHHWIFVREQQRAEWWPSSAKMVINQQWRKGIHIHDYQQAIFELTKVFPKKKAPEPPEYVPLPDYLL